MPIVDDVTARARWRDDGFTRGARGARNEITQMEKATRLLTRTLGGLSLGLAGRQVIRYADTWTQARNRVQLFTLTQAEANNVLGELFIRSNQARVALTSTAELYQRLAVANQQLKLSQSELLGVMDTVNRAIIISGVSSEAANAAIVQLGQGLASGALRGDELRSVLEQTPRLARAIAEGMGVTVGELRELGTQGALTAQAIVNSLQTQAETIDREFGKLDKTVGQSFTVLTNALTKFVGDMDSATGASQSLADVILQLANNLNLVAAGLTAVAAAGGFTRLLGVGGLVGAGVGGGLVAGGAALGYGTYRAGMETGRGAALTPQQQAYIQARNYSDAAVSAREALGVEFERGLRRRTYARRNEQNRAGALAAKYDPGNLAFPDLNIGARPFNIDDRLAAEKDIQETFDALGSSFDGLRAGIVAVGEASDRAARAAMDQDAAELALLDARHRQERVAALVAKATDEQQAALRTAQEAERAATVETLNKARADKEAADALRDARRRARELNTVLRSFAGLVTDLKPELSGVVSSLQGAIAGFSQGGVAGAIAGTVSVAHGLINVLGLTRDSSRDYAKELEAVAEATRKAREAQLDARQTAFSTLQRFAPDQAEAILRKIGGPLQDVLDTLGGDNLQRLVFALANADNGVQDLSLEFSNLRRILEDNGFTIDEYRARLEAYLGDDSLVSAANQLLALADSAQELEKAASGANDALERSIRAQYDVEEIRLRQRAQGLFADAGNDPYAQAAAFRTLQGQIAGLRSSEAAALAGARGGGAGGGAMAGTPEAIAAAIDIALGGASRSVTPAQVLQPDYSQPLELDVARAVVLVGQRVKVSLLDLVDVSELDGYIDRRIGSYADDRVGDGDTTGDTFGDQPSGATSAANRPRVRR